MNLCEALRKAWGIIRDSFQFHMSTVEPHGIQVRLFDPSAVAC